MTWPTWGAFTSANVSGGSAYGTLDVQNEATFDATGASYGTHNDLDGDGDLDLGGTDPASSDGYWAARAGGLRRSPTTTQTYTWKVATLWFTVTELIAGTGTTQINFVQRTGEEEGALWMPDNVAQNLQDGTSGSFTVGAPVVLTR